MLAEIFAGLDDIADIQESFMFDSDMAKLDKVKLNEVMADLEPRTVYLMFMPSYYEKWEYLARTIPPAIGKSYNIKATTPIVCKMIDLVNGDSEPADNWHYLCRYLRPEGTGRGWRPTRRCRQEDRRRHDPSQSTTRSAHEEPRR